MLIPQNFGKKEKKNYATCEDKDGGTFLNLSTGEDEFDTSLD